jgi:hypothetical protein
MSVEMGSGAMIYEYIPRFIKINSGIQQLIGGDLQTHRQYGNRMSILLFFENKESRLNTEPIMLIKMESLGWMPILLLFCVREVLGLNVSPGTMHPH